MSKYVKVTLSTRELLVMMTQPQLTPWGYTFELLECGNRKVPASLRRKPPHAGGSTSQLL